MRRIAALAFAGLFLAPAVVTAQSPATIRGQWAVLLASQRNRKLKESFEHGRTSKMSGMRWWFDYTRKRYVAFNIQ